MELLLAWGSLALLLGAITLGKAWARWLLAKRWSL